MGSPTERCQGFYIHPVFLPYHKNFIVFQAYRDQGVEQMFSWQAECLATEGVWDQSRDLVLAAPTSGGKSLVAELLAAKTSLRRGKKTLIVLPFKALVMEKTNYLKVNF
jgi:replicative superfamily II helicase